MPPRQWLPPLTGLVFFSTGLTACSGLSLNFHPKAAVPEPAGEVAAPVVQRTWSDLLGAAPAPTSWQVIPCENPALLCVEGGEGLIGTVEFISYPVAETELQLDGPDSETTALKAWVTDFLTTIKTDRAQADPSLVFLPALTEPVSVGSLTGLRYGFTIRRSNDILAERTVGYVATDGTTLYVFVTGLINGDPSGTFSNESTLRQFEPYLEEIMADLKL